MMKYRITVCLLVCFCVLLLLLLQNIAVLKIQPFQVLLTTAVGEYPCVFNIREEGVLEVVIGPYENDKKESYLDFFGEKAIKNNKRLSVLEISILNDLITEIKTTGDSEMDPAAEGMSIVYISVSVDNKEFRSLYHSLGPFSVQEHVQELAYKLIQMSPIITPYSATEAVRFYSLYGEENKRIGGEFKNILKLIEKDEDYIIIDKDSERYQEILKKDWGDLALEFRR